MKVSAMRCGVVGAAVFGLKDVSLATAGPLPGNSNIDVAVSNDAGALYGSGPDGTDLIDTPRRGLLSPPVSSILSTWMEQSTKLS
jgi:hypothetical protein